MARQARSGLAGIPHLLMQRVHEGQSLVRDDVDRQRFVDILRTAAKDHRVAIHAYAVSDQTWWALATPVSEAGLSLMVQAVGRQYVAFFNRRHAREGSLWSGRFRSCVLASAQDLLDAMALVELQAPLQGCSSAPHHLGVRVDPLIAEHAQFWTLGNTPFERDAAWRRRLDDGLPAARQSQLHDAVMKGWALGLEVDILRLQQLTDRRLTPAKRGRPPRSPNY